MKEKMRKMKGRNTGFTLVELIVVLVILAILAAILVPALLGWIDRAREKKELLNAKNCMTAVQAELTELYAQNAYSLKPGDYIIYDKDIKEEVKGNNGDVNATPSPTKVYPKPFNKRILETADVGEPYIVMFAVGSNYATGENDTTNINRNKNTTLHDKYTVYYMLYMQTKDSAPLYYFNGTWSKKNPRAGDKSDLLDAYNIIQTGPLNGKRLQYYIISNKTGYAGGKGEYWKYLKETLDKKWN